MNVERVAGVVAVLRFFAEEGADFCVWAEEEDPGQLEKQLPIPSELRQQMAAWIDEFNARTQEADPPWTADDLEAFDRRGLKLSRELQLAVGEEYQVRYGFLTAQMRQQATAVKDGAVEDGAALESPIRVAGVAARRSRLRDEPGSTSAG